MIENKLNIIFRCVLLSILIIVACISATSCSEAYEPKVDNSNQPQSVETPIYLIDPIEIFPQPVTTGKVTTISMKIENSGNVTGTYKADLLIDSVSSDHQSIDISAHSTGSLIFQKSFTQPGQYSISIGPQKITIRVLDSIETRPASTLKLDGGAIDGFDSLAGTTQNLFSAEPIVEGHMIKLTAPAKGFIINNIDIFGYLKDSTYDFNNNMVIGGTGLWVYSPEAALSVPAKDIFTVNIYDNHRTKLFCGDFNKQLFSNYPGWVTVDIGEIRVAGDFYIEVLTYNQPQIYGSSIYYHDYWNRYLVHTWYYQIMIGYEDAINVCSYASESGSIVPDRYFTYNWLIRAEGSPEN